MMIASRFRVRTTFALLLFAAVSACARPPQGDDEEPVPKSEPIAVHIRNENFLDMDVYAVIGGARRRLGMVSGNTSGDFSIEGGVFAGQSVSVVAIPIGGRGAATTGSLNIGAGQVIEFTVAPVLTQSRVSVHDP
jgi:hypothetical protein